jgi:hypothetical protein
VVETIKEDTTKENLDQSETCSDAGKKGSLAERVGDWLCLNCNNLNFSFRDICNRCDL